MTRIFTEGAEAGDTLFWTTITNNFIIETTVVRIGGRSFVMYDNSSVQKNVTAVSEFYFRIAFQFNTNTQAHELRWRNSATILGFLRYNTTSKCLDVYTGTGTLVVSGTKVIAVSTWYVLELRVKIDDSTGVIEHKIDGSSQTAFNGDTKPGTDTTVTNLVLASTSNNFYMDDLGFNDTAGSVDNSWLGDAHIYGLTPNADGDSSQFVGSDGNSTNNYLLVDEIPSNADTDYVESATLTNKDLYNFANLPTLPAGSVVKRVIVETRARELTADGDTFYLGVKSGSTEGWSSALTLGTSFAPQTAVFTTNPATSAAWTETEVNAMQAGVKVS